MNNDKKSVALQYDEALALFSSDPMRSFHCMQSLAEKNFPSAIFRVGWHYYTGTAVEADVGKAEACFKRVIESGSAGAARNYAVYYYGMVYYVSHDFDKAREIWELEDPDDYPSTVYWLAHVYRTGQGVTRTTLGLTKGFYRVHRLRHVATMGNASDGRRYFSH